MDSTGTIWFGGLNDTPKATLFAINPANGTVKWSKTPSGQKEFVGAPAIDINNWVYAAIQDCIFSVSPDGSSYTDRWAWFNQNTPDKYRTSSSLTLTDFTTSSSGGVTYTNQTLWFTETKLNGDNPIGGRLNSLDVQSSASTATYSQGWTWNFPGGSSEWAVNTPVVGPNGKVYVGSNTGKLYALTPGNSTPYWTKTLNGAVRSSVVIGFDGTLYVGTDGDTLYALNPADGSESWSWAAGSDVVSTPLIGADGAIYIATNGGKFICLSANPSLSATARKLWEETISGASFYYSSPVMGTDGALYIGARNIDTGQLVSFQGFGRPGATHWPMFARNTRRTGKYRPPYAVTTLGTFNYLGNTITPQWVNNSGVLVGHGYDGTVAYDRSLTWYNGSFTALGTMSGFTQEYYAWSINDSGTTAGWAKYYTNYYAPHYTAGYRRTYGGSWTELAPLYEFDSNLHLGYAEPEAINNDGIVVGKSKNNSGVFRATRWDSSAAENLESLEGDDQSYYSYAVFINQDGYIVGGSETAYTGNPIHAFLVAPDEQEMTAANDLGTPSGEDEDESFANGINDHGVIIMYAPTNNYANYRAFFKLPSSTTSGIVHTKDEDFVEVGFPGSPDAVLLNAINNLNQAVGTVAEGWTYYVSLVPFHLNQSASLSELAGSGWTIYTANHINDQGEIVGTANGGSVILRPQD